jgi:hypothetical protein
MYHLGFSGLIATLCQSNQSLSRAAYSFSLRPRGLNTLVLEQLADHDAAQGSPFVLAASQFMS